MICITRHLAVKFELTQIHLVINHSSPLLQVGRQQSEVFKAITTITSLN